MTAIQPLALEQWLVAHGEPVSAPVTIAGLGHGRSNLTCLARDGADHRWVLRRAPEGTFSQSAHDVTREHRVLSALADTDVPTPGVTELCRDERVTGAPLLVMEFIEGIVLEDGASAGAVTPAVRRAAALSFVDALARVHAVDLQATGLETPSGPAARTRPRQLRRWLRQGQADGATEDPQVQRVVRRLEQALPDEHDRTLVHGDCHLLNVVVDPSAGAVRALLDWELSTLGDPLADLGLALAYWPEIGDPLPPGPFAHLLLAGFPSRAELVERYVRASGRSVRSVAFWLVLSAWKVALISLGILGRLRSRGADQNEIDRRGAIVHTMLDRAEMFALGAGL